MKRRKPHLRAVPYQKKDERGLEPRRAEIARLGGKRLDRHGDQMTGRQRRRDRQKEVPEKRYSYSDGTDEEIFNPTI